MKLYSPDRRELMTVSGIERQDDRLIIRAKVFGTMPMTASLTPENLREGLKLLGIRGVLFALTMLFRKSRSSKEAGK